MTSAAYIHVNQTYTLMKINHVTNERFPRILSPRHKKPAMGSRISHVDFCLQGEERTEEVEEFLFRVKEKKNDLVNLSNNRYTK